MAKKGTGAVAGQKCTVTSGPNKGKTGTYTVDDQGNLWCEGDWGGTQCGTKCADMAASATVFEYVDSVDGQVKYEVEGLYEIDGGGVFHCRARIDAATGASESVTAIPVAAISVTALGKSETELDRLVARVIEAHMATMREQG